MTVSSGSCVSIDFAESGHRHPALFLPTQQSRCCAAAPPSRFSLVARSQAPSAALSPMAHVHFHTGTVSRVAVQVLDQLKQLEAGLQPLGGAAAAGATANGTVPHITQQQQQHHHQPMALG